MIGGSKVDAGTFGARWGSLVSISSQGTTPAKGHSCGGTLIAVNVVLTARHCVEQGGFSSRPSRLRVLAGSPSLARGLTVAHVREIYRPAHSPSTYFSEAGDIALLELTMQGLPGVPVAPIARPEHAAWWGGGAGRDSGVRMAGWGISRDADLRRELEYGPTEVDLRQVDVPVLSTGACQARATRDTSIPLHICAGTIDVAATAPQEARTACYGDSGGPLMADDPAGVEPPRIIGVVSRGMAETCAKSPTVFTNVSQHVAWIDQVLATVSTQHDLRSQSPSFEPRRAGHGRVRFAPYGGTAAPTDVFAVDMSLGSGNLELARFTGTAAPQLQLPPTRDGRTTLRVRHVNGPGASTAPGFGVGTRTDRIAPRAIARFTARRVGYRHELAWTAATDPNDRVVAYFIEQRRVGARRWTPEYFYDCAECWMNARARPQRRSTHVLLPGRREFRISALDRAGNWGPPTISR